MATNDGFSAEEREAMKERAKELRQQKSGKGLKGEEDLFDKISKMAPDEQPMAKRLHELVMTVAPHLQPKTWYGMPAWAKDGKVICFFQAASKFNARYATFGFQEDARLDDGDWWPTSYALIRLTPSVEAEITELVRRAAS